MASAPHGSPSEEWLDRFCRRFLQLRPAEDPKKCLEVVTTIWNNVFLMSPESAAELAAQVYGEDQ